MKILCNLWKTGVALLLCFSMLSVSVLAHDEHTDAEEHEQAHAEETHEFFELTEVAHEEGELHAVMDDSENLSVEEEEYLELPETEYRTNSDAEVESTPAAGEGTAEAPDKNTCDKKTEPAIGTVVKSGDCGFSTGSLFYEVTYLGNDGYKLTIHGTGKMLTIGATYGAPWHEYSADIVSIEIQNGVESIAQFAFTGCDQVTNITIPASVTTIYPKSFQMSGLKAIYFLGSYYEKFKPGAFDGTSDLIIYYDQADPSWNGVSFDNITMQGSNITLETVMEQEATCTTDGNPMYYYNAVWGKYFSDAEGKLEITDKKELVFPALGHDWDEGRVTQKPTATEGGVMSYTCKRCEDIRYDSIPATGEDTIPDEPEVPGDDTQTPGDGVQEPDLKDDSTLDKVDVNVNYQNRPDTGQTAGEPAQMENTSAGQVKTADENPYVLYLVLLALSGVVLIGVIKKRILG